jgi:cytidine deaminase
MEAFHMKKTIITSTITLFLSLILPITSASAAFSALADIENRKAEMQSAIQGFPENAQKFLLEIVLDKDFAGVISAEQSRKLSSILGLSANDTALALISLAGLYAIPSISNFHVGAVAVGLSGAMYFGCNLEFPGQALSFSVHAEQAATMNAWTHSEKGLKAIAITAPPCGYCRQFLNELSTADDLTILLQNAPPISLRALLPKPFGPQDLNMKERLMDDNRQNLKLAKASDDKVIKASLEAASASYAPYSNNYAAVALESEGGVIVSGRYAENAAYNPSMSPFQAALVLYNFANQDFSKINRAVLVQTRDRTANQKDAARAVLSTLPNHPELEVYSAVKE